MEHDEISRREAEQNKSMQRDNIARKGLDSSRPHRGVVEGHTKPCEDCGALDWRSDNSRGEVSCGGCGLVVEENVIDPGIDWTNHENSTDRSRIGAPTTHTLADKGLKNVTDEMSNIANLVDRSAGVVATSVTLASENLFKRKSMIAEDVSSIKAELERHCRLYVLIENITHRKCHSSKISLTSL